MNTDPIKRTRKNWTTGKTETITFSNLHGDECSQALTGSSRFSWRKSVGRWGQPTIYSLHKGNGSQWLAIVQGIKDGLWFWYGGGRNTCGTPTDLKTAKKEAMAHIKSVETNTQSQPPQVG